MNRFFSFFLYFILLELMCSCTSKKIQDAESFDWSNIPEPIHLKGDSISFDEILLMPTRIVVIDSFLLTKNRNVERFFHIYNLNTKKKVGERIPFGMGPKEMLDPVWLFMPKGDLAVFDRNKRKMNIYPKNLLLTCDTVSPIKQITFNYQLMNPVVLPEVGLLSSNLQAEDKKFIAVDFEGNKLCDFGEYPNKYKDKTLYEKSVTFMGDMAVKPDGSRWVMTHKTTDILEIYDNKLNLLKRLQGPDQTIPDLIEENGRIRRQGRASKEAYFFPFATNECFYVLYDGREYDTESSTRYLRDKLFAFDWEGNPIKYYQLSEPILHFSIDIKQQILYGVSDYPEFHIIAFPMQ